MRFIAIVLFCLLVSPALIRAGSTDFETLAPAVTPDKAVQVQSARPSRFLLNTGALLQYEHHPVVLYDARGTRLDNGVAARLQVRGFLAVRLFQRLMVGLDIPVTLFDAANEGVPAFRQARGAKLNGILTHARYSVFLRPDWAIAATGSLRFPTGTAGGLGGFDGRWFEWSLGAAGEWAPYWGFVRGNLVFEEKEETRNPSLGVFKDDALTLRAAAGYHLPRDWTGFAEISTLISIGGPKVSPFNLSGELIVGAHQERQNWVFGPAVGVGMSHSYGVPAFRLLWSTWWQSNLGRVFEDAVQMASLTVRARTDGQAEPGLPIEIAGALGSVTLVTDQAGNVTQPVKPGRYTVRHLGEGFEPAVTTVNLMYENSYELFVHLQPYVHNAVRLVDAVSGDPVTTALVSIQGVTQAETAGPGAYTLGATSGHVEVKAEAPGYVTATRSFAADSTDLTFALQPEGNATWTIYVANHAGSVSEASLVVRQGLHLVMEQPTSVAGYVQFALAAGEARASVSHPDYATAAAAIQVTMPGEYETSIELSPLSDSSNKDSKLRRIVVHVMDQNLRQAVSAGAVRLAHNKQRDLFEAGYWAYVTDTDASFQVSVTAEGYHANTITLSTASPVTTVYLRNRAMDAVTVQKDRLNITQKVMFKTGSATIALGSYLLLDAVAATLQRASGIRHIMIVGHTDSVGRRSSNIRLSQQRADAVRQYLLEKGLDPDTLVAEGRGPDEPIADNSTAAGREENRRVEFLIVEQE